MIGPGLLHRIISEVQRRYDTIADQRRLQVGFVGKLQHFRFGAAVCRLLPTTRSATLNWLVVSCRALFDQIS